MEDMREDEKISIERIVRNYDAWTYNCFIWLIYVVWYKSNETGNAVHEPTTLLPPQLHGS